jgi:hypothetical protein
MDGRAEILVSDLVTPSGPPPKLIFDQLEPRMLMSADPVVIDLSALQPTHDVVVRLLNQVVTTNNQTTNIERVEAVDANNPANVLSSQVIPTGSNVTVLAGQGSNNITLDLSGAPPSTTQPQARSTARCRSGLPASIIWWEAAPPRCMARPRTPAGPSMAPDRAR